jgi:hypothetical protein
MPLQGCPLPGRNVTGRRSVEAHERRLRLTGVQRNGVTNSRCWRSYLKAGRDAAFGRRGRNVVGGTQPTHPWVPRQSSERDRSHLRTGTTAPNPTTTAILRAGGLADRTLYFGYDLAASGQHLPNDNAHDGGNVGAIATFLATDGAQIVDPDGTGPIWETPIAGPLPEGVNFVGPAIYTPASDLAP